MKHHIIYSTLPIALMLFFCWNGTIIDSGSKSKLPDVNFYGTIECYEETFNFEYLLIKNKYEKITVHPIQSSLKNLKKRITENSANNNETNKTEDPTKSKGELSLFHTKTIELQDPHHPTASIIMLNQKEFAEIVVTLINGAKQNFLIENDLNISCQQVTNGSSNTKNNIFIPRFLPITKIKKLTIKGYRSTNYSDDSNVTKNSSDHIHQEDQKKEVAKHTENLLDQIEENVKNLSQENASTFEKMKSNIITLLKSLREQLQKMLNMLQ